MKKVLALMFLLSVVSVGCESMSQETKTGAGLGAVTGAIIGGVVGHQDDEHGVEGALIGGAAGAVAGGLIGNAMGDGKSSSNAQYLSIPQIVDLAVKGTPDDIIISEIDRTQSKYTLTSETITYLKDNKVSDKVIDHMMQAK